MLRAIHTKFILVPQYLACMARHPCVLVLTARIVLKNPPTIILGVTRVKLSLVVRVSRVIPEGRICVSDSWSSLLPRSENSSCAPTFARRFGWSSLLPFVLLHFMCINVPCGSSTNVDHDRFCLRVKLSGVYLDTNSPQTSAISSFGGYLHYLHLLNVAHQDTF